MNTMLFDEAAPDTRKALEEAVEAHLAETQEALLWEKDADRREWIADQAEAAEVQIDDRLSEEIVVERTDRHGRAVLPWLYPGCPPPGCHED